MGRFSRSTYSKNMRVSVFMASRRSAFHSGNFLRVGLDHIEIADFQPLAGEVGGEGAGARIGQHALHLRIEDGGIVQLPLRGQSDQLVVGHGTPQEVAEARGQLEIGNGMRGRIGAVFDA